MSGKPDKCEPIRTKLSEKKVDVSKYDLCYTKKMSLDNDTECSLCRHDKRNKTFICRPNEFDEEIMSVKDFCKPLKKVNRNELQNVYYPGVLQICKAYKDKYDAKRSQLSNVVTTDINTNNDINN